MKLDCLPATRGLVVADLQVRFGWFHRSERCRNLLESRRQDLETMCMPQCMPFWFAMLAHVQSKSDTMHAILSRGRTIFQLCQPLGGAAVLFQLSCPAIVCKLLAGCQPNHQQPDLRIFLEAARCAGPRTRLGLPDSGNGGFPAVAPFKRSEQHLG